MEFSNSRESLKVTGMTFSVGFFYLCGIYAAYTYTAGQKFESIYRVNVDKKEPFSLTFIKM